MTLDVNLLPKKFNEFNYFEKNEVGCALYSYSLKNEMTIVCRLEDFEIEKNFCVDDKALNMLKVLSPYTSIVVNTQFIIKSKKGNYKAKLIETELIKPKLDFQETFKCDIDRLKIASQFVSKNDKRPILTGVNVNSNGDINATDSFMAYRYLGEKEDKNAKDITIPSDFIDFVSKEFNGKVSIWFNNNSCMIRKDNIMYVNKLLEGKYPDMTRIFNNKLDYYDLEFNTSDLKEKFSIAKNVGAYSDIGISITFENNKFSSRGGNDYEVELISNINNENNYKFTLSLDKFNNIISNINNDYIYINYNSSVKPIFINENRNEFLILPIRVE